MSYQKKVNALTGAMGPTTTAYWPKMTHSKGTNYAALAAQPLYYNPAIGQYVTSYDQISPTNIALGTVNFSGGHGGRKFGKRRRVRRKSSRRSRRKSRKFAISDLLVPSRRRKSRSKRVRRRRRSKSSQ